MNLKVVQGGKAADQPQPFRSCNFCDRELTAIELWCDCQNMKIAHANYVLERLVRKHTTEIDRLMTRALP